MRHVYSGPVDPPEPCCTEQPDHKVYGYPAPDVDQIIDNLTPEQTRELLRYGLFAAADIGSDIAWNDYTARNITDDLTNALPDSLPPIEGDEHGKPAARWWSDLIGAEYSSGVAWTPEEDDE